jgi:hypothetical protein
LHLDIFQVSVEDQATVFYAFVDYEYDDEGYYGNRSATPVVPPIDMTPMAAAIPHHEKVVQAEPVQASNDSWSNMPHYGAR